MPQPSQFSGSFVTFVSQTVASFPSHSRFGSVHVEMPQTPSLQAGVPRAEGQTRPHIPQWRTLTFVLVSHPSRAPLMQSALPVLQVMPHVPSSLQMAVPPFALQTLVQLPQVSAADKSASQPSSSCPLQSSNPSAQPASQTPPTHMPVAFGGSHS